jgi:hypothetical protein
MDRGFHSLVKVLLEAGAIDDGERFEALIYQALSNRRFDLVELFVANGFDPASIDMAQVLESWDPAMMQYFIDRGASLEKGLPLAQALCAKVRTALKIFKSYRDTIPGLQEQANIALRHHARAGNLKWISLMLWAGADPYAPGVAEVGDFDPDGSEEYEGLSALGWAALYNHFEIFSLRQVKLDPARPELRKFIAYLDKEEGLNILQRLLSMGMEPNDSESLGCPAIQSHLNQLGWLFSSYFTWEREEGKIDTERDRMAMKSIHLLAMHGGKWKPQDNFQLNSARRGLLKVKPEYTAEFVWLMSKYNAASLEAVEKLLSTPKMKRHISRIGRVAQIVAAWKGRLIEA